jgi:hypothetical protein
MTMPRYYEPITTKPLPSSRLPTLVVLLFLAAIVLVFMFFLRPPGKLLGSPIKANEYEKYMTAPKPKPAPHPAPVVVPPGVPDTSTGSATVIAPVATPNPPTSAAAPGATPKPPASSTAPAAAPVAAPAVVPAHPAAHSAAPVPPVLAHTDTHAAGH